MLHCLRVKNMVCPRCISAVENKLAEMGYMPALVELGKVFFENKLEDKDKKRIATALECLGFELLEDSVSIVIEEIKQNVLSWVRIKGEHPNLSEFLQNNLNKEYSILSRLFSDVNGITIERYSISLRIEYAKELLSYDQMTISEIAYEMGYSSAAHLSMQFKKETGLSPSQFKTNKDSIARKPLDSI